MSRFGVWIRVPHHPKAPRPEPVPVALRSCADEIGRVMAMAVQPGAAAQEASLNGSKKDVRLSEPDLLQLALDALDVAEEDRPLRDDHHHVLRKNGLSA